MGIFERFLSGWVALAILAGLALGAAVPAWPEAIASLEVAGINLPSSAMVFAFAPIAALLLVEVPVMLSLVAIANRNRRLFPTGHV
ncbi:arsenate efflux pump [Synechococcus sp. RS9909]|uniref:hypothetical protein n=1 Tax=unclassified Synechococcus TaxID=2626047 RepID=UPI000068F787|nr:MULTISPECIES: hypothetical protein [unclassified Synechococcus]EAQ69072.1 hypothetical protein RS9917_11550 [Synechococcus sp. RS9917]QNI79669.1 arsenate efflux pump [Synechococcus sp. RS9909]